MARAKAKGKAKKSAEATSKPRPKKASPTKSRSPKATKVKLLSGGNPQIAKADGDAPVQEYIAAMPGWKSAVGKQIDTIVSRHLPGVRKAVKWNSPFYASKKTFADHGWLIAVHVFTQFIRVTFFNGMALKPVPPGPSKMAPTRSYDIREGEFDAAQFSAWVKQAAALPGWKP
jgi:hypothetical protein